MAGFQISKLYFGFRIPLVGFRIPLAGFRIPKPWIPDSTDQSYLDSGFRITLHGANEDSRLILPKINSDLPSVFMNKKIADDIKVAEAKPPLINKQCLVYKFKCDLCDADYVGKHLRDAHNQKNRDLREQFTILILRNALYPTKDS